LIGRSEGGKSWRTIYDPYNGEEVTLSKEEVRMLMRIRQGHFPHVEVNPYEDYNDWFSSDVMEMPLSDAPEPKRRFIPSQWEAKKVVHLVRAIRRGWLKTEKKPKEEEDVYLMWGDDNQSGQERTAAGLTYIPPPKLKLPGHEESYRFVSTTLNFERGLLPSTNAFCGLGICADLRRNTSRQKKSAWRKIKSR
jgi:ribosome biogenesis protein ERB1